MFARKSNLPIGLLSSKWTHNLYNRDCQAEQFEHGWHICSDPYYVVPFSLVFDLLKMKHLSVYHTDTRTNVNIYPILDFPLGKKTRWYDCNSQWHLFMILKYNLFMILKYNLKYSTTTHLQRNMSVSFQVYMPEVPANSKTK